MIALPAALGGPTTLTAWRLDAARFRDSWERGEGARIYGGRWNSPGRPAVYLSLEPSTAILEVAVHKGFGVLGRLAHVMTSVVIDDPGRVHVAQPEDLPDPGWLLPGWPSAEQQAFGDRLAEAHPFVLLPSTVSKYSWNLVWNPAVAGHGYRVLMQEGFVLDPRLRGAG